VEPKIEPSTAKPKKEESPESAGKHVKAFIWMMVLTAVSFILVGTGTVPVAMVIPILLILAAIQVALQLFTFMHLDQKGSFFPILFMVCGIIGAIVCVLAMTLWV
jgi:cytochrome c oxidase subunit IV